MSKKTNKIPTAEEFINNSSTLEDLIYGDYKDDINWAKSLLAERLKEFAQLHVKAALEAAAENAAEIPSAYSYKKTILNSYSDENIK